MIHPIPYNTPLSKKEFETIKKNRESTFRIPQVEFAEALETRQKIAEDSRKKTKAAKSGRKYIEKTRTHHEKATSTKIRKKPSSIPEDHIAPEISSDKQENENDIDDKTPFPIELNWNEKDIDN